MSTREDHRRRLMRDRAEQEPIGLWGWVGAAVLAAAMILSAWVGG